VKRGSVSGSAASAGLEDLPDRGPAPAGFAARTDAGRLFAYHLANLGGCTARQAGSLELASSRLIIVAVAVTIGCRVSVAQPVFAVSRQVDAILLGPRLHYPPTAAASLTMAALSNRNRFAADRSLEVHVSCFAQVGGLCSDSGWQRIDRGALPGRIRTAWPFSQYKYLAEEILPAQTPIW